MFPRSEFQKPLQENVGVGRLSPQQEMRQWVTGRALFSNIATIGLKGIKLESFTAFCLTDKIPYDAQLQYCVVDLQANPPSGTPPVMGMCLLDAKLLGLDTAKKQSVYINKATRDYAMSLWKEGRWSCPGLPAIDADMPSSSSVDTVPTYNKGEYSKLTPVGETSLLMSEEIKSVLQKGGKQSVIDDHEKEFNPKKLKLQGNAATPDGKRSISEVAGTNPDEARPVQLDHGVVCLVKPSAHVLGKTISRFGFPGAPQLAKAHKRTTVWGQHCET